MVIRAPDSLGSFGAFSYAAPGFVALFEVNSYALSLRLFVSSLCFLTIHHLIVELLQV